MSPQPTPPQPMSPERWKQVEALYHAVLERDPGAGALLLEQADPELRREVESLLYQPSQVALDRPAWEVSDKPNSAGTLKAGSLLGPYRIEAEIGAGGMGQVWRAHDTRLGRDVAIKTSREQFNDRFQREARAIAALNHPNICRLFDVGPDYLVMELVEGQPPGGPLPLERAIEYAGQILDALDAAHREGIVHRDLKPANILVTKHGVKLLDFGLAKKTTASGAADADAATTALTRAGQILGTLQYMAPEQLQGKEADARSDIFSFGCVLYEMLSGKRAFAGESGASLMAAILEREPAALDLAPPLQRVIKTCLAKDPDQRFQNALDLKRNLIWALEQAASTAVATTSEGPTAARGSRWTVVWMAAFGVVALAFVTLAAVHFREKIPAPPAMHLTVPLPSTVTGVGYLALSPDGRTLALGVRDKDATRNGLALRPLDSDQLRMLPDTADAKGPFWSPDGQKIAFTESDGKLRLMSASGGPADVVFGVGGCGCGGAWGPGGVILIVNTQDQLLRCNAERGGCSPLAGDPTLKRESPSFLPDGKHFLFTGRTTVSEGEAASRSGVYVASLEEPGAKRLLPDTSKAIYAQGHTDNDPGGHGFLLFRRDDALVGQAFDPATLTLSGDVFTIAEDVSKDSSANVMASAAANGVLVYGTGRNLNNAQLTWLDRTGKLLSVAGPVRDQHAVALSPQGNQILVNRGPVGGRDHGLWLRDAARDSEWQLTSSAQFGDGEAGVWSPDGKVAAFVSGGNLYRKDVLIGGKEELILKSNGAPKRTSDWSSDGRYLLFTELDSKANGDIWVLPDPGGSPGKPYAFQRTDAIESQAQFSPDGKWIAYTSNESGSDEVYVRPFPSRPGQWKVSAGSGFEPRWRSDGKELFYWTRGSPPRSRLMAVSVKAVANGSFAAGEPQPLFEHRVSTFPTPSNWWTYSPAPDGQRFLVLSLPDEQETIHVLSNWTQMLRGKP